MKELDAIIERATGKVEEHYFLLPIHGSDPVHRERVYCYELYHRMRCEWPEPCDYSLNGEVDKVGHPVMAPLVGVPKPDFLVHIPGNMEGNHAVIEVKPHTARSDGIAKDIGTLSRFARAGYDRAIYLIYGFNADKAVERFHEEYQKMPDLPPLEVWVHYAPGIFAARKI